MQSVYHVIIMRFLYPIAKSACSTSKAVKIENIKTILPKTKKIVYGSNKEKLLDHERINFLLCAFLV